MVNEQVSILLLQRRLTLQNSCWDAPRLTLAVTIQFLQHCKCGVRIVNVARGGLLDYDAVKAGLEFGIIAGMGLDVQWQVLLLFALPQRADFHPQQRQTSKWRVCNRNQSIHMTFLRSIRKSC